MNNYTEIPAFKNIDELFEEVFMIGDVTTIEGKKRMILFLAKIGELYNSYYSFKVTLPSGLQGDFNGYFSKNVRDTVKYAFKMFLEKCNPPALYYYFTKDGNLRPGLDEYDNIIGNAINNIDVCLQVGMHNINVLLYKDYQVQISGYNKEEEITLLESQCAEYIAQKEATDKREM